MSKAHSVRVLMAVVLLVGAIVPSMASTRVRVCGRRLTELLQATCTTDDGSVCFNGAGHTPAERKRAFPNVIGWHGQRLALDRMLQGQLLGSINDNVHAADVVGRVKRSTDTGVATECCEHGCTYKYLKTFCCRKGGNAGNA